ncbi:hypothetical protein GJ654_17335 [Rhodoblastus acidophilus]|uniref:Uncharacterized protein n=1 Tax=Rhodoblastus acidophilus TaxID=1074 RepID=A0A6N8DR24_RHOAC|nr:hypothetical protein [Rhodoblastus acidophilus]MCW2276011.1 hypothetical protein [Rhodoblastus acidophilus]MTV32748.1 hypothetical protein [Rhodoblastus acidophilus]
MLLRLDLIEVLGEPVFAPRLGLGGQAVVDLDVVVDLVVHGGAHVLGVGSNQTVQLGPTQEMAIFHVRGHLHEMGQLLFSCPASLFGEELEFCRGEGFVKHRRFQRFAPL